VLTQIISFYEMLSGNSRSLSTSFENYFEERKTQASFNITSIVSRWAKYFDDVRIIDYYGTLARTTTHDDSLQKQLFCEVMGIKPLCSYGFNAVPRVNAESDGREETQEFSEMNHIFHHYAAKRSCELEVKATPFEPSKYNFDIPTTRYEITPEFITWSTDIDKDLRESYGDIIMNGNATVSREKAEAASLEVVDTEAVYQHKGWMEAFDDVIRRSKKEGLCSHHHKLMQ
jgi:hypothetical protein